MGYGARYFLEPRVFDAVIAPRLLPVKNRPRKAAAQHRLDGITRQGVLDRLLLSIALTDGDRRYEFVRGLRALGAQMSSRTPQIDPATLLEHGNSWLDLLPVRPHEGASEDEQAKVYDDGITKLYSLTDILGCGGPFAEDAQGSEEEALLLLDFCEGGVDFCEGGADFDGQSFCPVSYGIPAACALQPSGNTEVGLTDCQRKRCPQQKCEGVITWQHISKHHTAPA